MKLNSKITVIILNLGIKIIIGSSIDANASKIISMSRAIVFSHISFKILVLVLAQFCWSSTVSLYLSKMVIISATIANETEKRAISILIITS